MPQELGENAHVFFFFFCIIILITVIAAKFSKARIPQHSLGWGEKGELKVTTKRPFVVRGQNTSSSSKC